MNVEADEVIKDISSKLANTQVENSMLFVENTHLKEENSKLKQEIKDGQHLHKDK